MKTEEIMKRIEIVRSDRKTISVTVYPDGRVVGRIPKKTTLAELRGFIGTHEARIGGAVDKADRKKALPAVRRMTKEELASLTERAKKVIPERVRVYAPLVGTDYGKITIRHQRSRWGSCTAKGDLNFNCLLLLAPDRVLDSVVVHELCHRKQMNHSNKFYAELYRVFPGYDEARKWLKEHGSGLIASLPDN